MPWYLGGHGDFGVGFVNIPFLPVDESVLFYGLFQFGIRLQWLIAHNLSVERGNDYEEMLLHDTVTCFLCFGYLVSNFLPVGTMVIILHDVSDILCHVSKGTNVSTFSDFAPVPFVGAQLLWLWFRLYSLPMIIWEITKHGYPEDRAQFNPFITLNVVFLSTLLAMHVIWFMMFQRVNWSILSKMNIDEKEFNCASTIEKVEEVSISPVSCSTASGSVSDDSAKEHSD